MSYNKLVPGEIDLVGSPDRFPVEDLIYASTRHVSWLSATHGDETVEKKRWNDRLAKERFVELNSEIPVRGTGLNGRPYIWGDNTDPSCALVSSDGVIASTGNFAIACLGKSGTAQTSTLWSIPGGVLNQDLSLRYRHDSFAQLCLGGVSFKTMALAPGDAYFEVSYDRATGTWIVYINGVAQTPHVTQAWTQESTRLAALANVNYPLTNGIRNSARSCGLYELFALNGAAGVDMSNTEIYRCRQWCNNWYGLALPLA